MDASILKKPWAYHTIAGVVGALLYVFLMFQGEHLADGDTYFHIKIAQLITEQGIVYQLPWMAATFHAERYVDFHFLYHYSLVPFALIFEDGEFAAKIAHSVFFGFSVAMLSLLLKALRVRSAWFWLVFFAISSPIFVGRMIFARGSVLFIGIIFLFLHALETRRYRWLAVISTLSVWGYQAFPILSMIVITYTLVAAVRERRFERAVLFVVPFQLGAMIIHPAFPHQFQGYYVEFFIQFSLHAFRPENVDLIGEWTAPVPRVIFWALLVTFPLLLYRIALPQRRDQTVILDQTLLLMCLFLIATLSVSIKPYEYFVPLVTPYLARGILRGRSEAVRILRALLVALMLLLPGGYVLGNISRQFEQTDPTASFDAAQWLRENSEENSIAIIPWPEFPKFFFKNHHNRYTYGLNPAYALEHDPRLYQQLQLLERGMIINPERLADEKVFGARYIVTYNRPQALINRLVESAGAKPVHFNDTFVIFELDPAALDEP